MKKKSEKGKKAKGSNNRETGTLSLFNFPFNQAEVTLWFTGLTAGERQLVLTDFWPNMVRFIQMVMRRACPKGVCCVMYFSAPKDSWTGDTWNNLLSISNVSVCHRATVDEDPDRIEVPVINEDELLTHSRFMSLYIDIDTITISIIV